MNAATPLAMGAARKPEPHAPIQAYLIGPALASAHEATLLERGVVIHRFSSAAQFLRASPRLAPGVLVLDLAERPEGLVDLSTLLQRRPVASAIVVGPPGDVAFATRAMRAGAADVVTAPLDGFRLARAIFTAANAVRKMSTLARLSDRERDVLAGMTDGLTNKQIGIRLGISYRTVETHRSHLMRKLGAQNLAEVLALVFGASKEQAKRPRPVPEPDEGASSSDRQALG